MKKTSNDLMSAENWLTLAEMAARDACENHFESRRGVWHLEDVNKLCLYNNNPYANYPHLRDEETIEFRAWLEENGIKELAYRTYPESGSDAGYTYAMIIDAGIERLNDVVEEMRRILQESGKRIALDS